MLLHDLSYAWFHKNELTIGFSIGFSIHWKWFIWMLLLRVWNFSLGWKWATRNALKLNVLLNQWRTEKESEEKTERMAWYTFSKRYTIRAWINTNDVHFKHSETHQISKYDIWPIYMMHIFVTYPLQPFRHVAIALKHVQLNLHRCTLANYGHFYVISLWIRSRFPPENK